MAKGGAGRLSERVSFFQRGEFQDQYGNTVSDWVLQFQTAASYQHLRGGEAVMAARLTNKHPLVVRIRTSTAARSVTAEWKLTDTRTGVEYAINDVTHDVDRTWIDLLCERGVVP
ncbi:phage head closure protein [Ensifer sp. YR511]|uniref:phage head closure protein n=1 Tax=Ensifer sp. YR511 TaxID=1855294 RepID=UPI00088E3476|nr:phage head closure protein [Ensifer sp. YR511]SDN84835.1 phage head-tail adaptor, putative, SPP1 family [Ensifer sp. YR511]